MSEIHEALDAEANADSQRSVQPRTDPFRHELLVHCYRPCFALFQRDAAHSYQLTVLSAQSDKIVQIDDYLGLASALFAHFKLSVPPAATT